MLVERLDAYTKLLGIRGLIQAAAALIITTRVLRKIAAWPQYLKATTHYYYMGFPYISDITLVPLLNTHIYRKCIDPLYLMGRMVCVVPHYNDSRKNNWHMLSYVIVLFVCLLRQVLSLSLYCNLIIHLLLYRRI